MPCGVKSSRHSAACLVMAAASDGVAATTLNKVCGSGMKATMMAMDLIAAGSADTVVAGGMESMSNAPYLLPKARGGLRMGHANMQDSLFTDGLEDAAFALAGRVVKPAGSDLDPSDDADVGASSLGALATTLSKALDAATRRARATRKKREARDRRDRRKQRAARAGVRD